MERLTELKVGQELNPDILEAWSRPEIGKNLTHPGAKWISSTNVYGSDRKIRSILTISSDNFEIKNSFAGSLLFRKAGFIEFYNQFYKLDTQSVAKSKFVLGQNWKIWIGDNPELYEKVYDKLIALGMSPNINVQNSKKLSIYCYSTKNLAHTNDSIFFDKKDEYQVLLMSDLFPEEFAKERPIMDYRNLSQVEFCLPDKETQDKFLTKLFELGYELNDRKELWHEYISYWRIGDNKRIVGSYSPTKLTLMDYKLIINTNNTPLNTPVNGNKIIVCKPVKTITGGQRPKGTSISGKTRSTTIRVGHLSHRAINS